MLFSRPVRDRLRQTVALYGALDRRVWLMAGVRAVNTMGLSLAMAFMAIYLVDDRGLAAATYGGIYLAANLLQSLAQGWSGELSDALGRRRIIIASLFVRAFVIAGIGAEVLAGVGIPFIAATLIGSAFLRGCFEPVAYALVADVVEPGQRAAAYGLQRMGTNLGWAIGPALGGLLSAVLGYGHVFFIAAGFLWLAAAVTATVDDPGAGAEDDGAPSVSLRAGLVEALSRGDTALLMLCALLFAIVHVQLFTTLSVYGAAELGLSKADLGLAYTVNGAVVLAMQIPAVGVIDRAGPGRALVIGSLLYVVAFVGIGLANDLPQLGGAVLVLTLGEILVAPALQTAAATIGDRRRMGRAFGLLGLAQMLGVAMGPLLGGLLFDHLRNQHMVLWSVIAGLAAALTVAHLRLASRL